MPGKTPEARSLELLATLITMDVTNALQSAVVRAAADLTFHDKREWFFTNPENTFLYRAVRALEDRSIVHIGELLNDKSKLLNLSIDIRRKVDLVLHRDALSHPGKISWGGPGRQDFHDKRRVWLDLRSALVWDMQRSVNEALATHGLEPTVTSIDVTWGMALALSGILRLSVTADSYGGIPAENDIFEGLKVFGGRYREFIEKRIAEGRITADRPARPRRKPVTTPRG